MAKTCLIIDNENQEESGSIDEIIREARKKNISVECHQFLLGNVGRDDLLTKGEIDLEKVIPAFKKEFRGINFDLIAIDWDFEDGDSGVNGIKFLRHLEHCGIRKSTPKLLYSGVLKAETETLFENYKKGRIKFSAAWQQIKTLIDVKVVDFVDRTEYEKAIVSFLDKNIISTDIAIINELGKYPELVFENTYPKFQGKTLEEIVSIIQTDYSTGSKFNKEIIERAVSHMVELNS